MKSNWIHTNEYYHQIIAAPDMAARETLYQQLFIQPWQQMMTIMAPMFQADPADPFAVARAWAWLLPQDLSETPAVLQKLEAAQAWHIGAEALAKGTAYFEAGADRIPFDEVSGWLIAADPARSDPIGRGYTGAIDWTVPRLVVQIDTPNAYTLSRLPGAVVHEFHHLIRLRLFPWDITKTNVADYIILEGMAESLAGALFGEGVLGYYVTDFDEAELAAARSLIGENLETTGFNVIRGYIFGDSLAQKHGFTPVGMPNYGGYAIGYRIVQAYLNRTGKSMREATFLPTQEIIEESQFFDKIYSL